MPSNRAVADTVECYMDDLVRCFEDFVKKSLIVITVGIAAVVGMFVYLLMVITERTPIGNVVTEGAASAHNQPRNMNIDDCNNQTCLFNKSQPSSLRDESNPSLNKSPRKTMSSTGVNTVSAPLTKKPSHDEIVLSNVSLTSCTKLNCRDRTNGNMNVQSRVPVRQGSFISSKRKSAHAIRPSDSRRSAKQHSQKSPLRSNHVLLISDEDINSIDKRIAKLILTIDKLLKEVNPYTKMVGDYVWTACSSLPGWIASNYLVISMVFLVLIFSFLLPDISQKIRKNNELKAMKNFVNLMQDEVKRAEVACLTANEEMCHLHCALTDQGTETSDSRPEDLDPSQFPPAGESAPPGLIPEELGKKLDSLVDYTISTLSLRKRKSQLCQSCTRICSTPNKN